jgi:hypothetical protein
MKFGCSAGAEIITPTIKQLTQLGFCDISEIEGPVDIKGIEAASSRVLLFA